MNQTFRMIAGLIFLAVLCTPSILHPPYAQDQPTISNPDLTGQWTKFGVHHAKNLTIIQGILGVENIGTEDARTVKIAFYLSNDAALDDGDTRIRTRKVRSLSTGKSTTMLFRYRSKATLEGKFIIAEVDSNDQVLESDEGNNIVLSPQIQFCIIPDADGDGDSADDLQEILNKGGDLNLCENHTFHLTTNQCAHTALCYTRNGQKIYTNNSPNAETGTSSAAVLRIDNPSVTSILTGSFSNIQLKSVVLDGNRANFGYLSSWFALVEMGFDTSGQIIEHNLFRDTRTWSTLQVHEGGLGCSNVVVAYNKIEDAGCDKDGNGCAPGDTPKTWADGISFACQSSSVHHNTIVNATDGGIVLFAPRGSEVYNNTITAVDRIMLGGINMVDDVTYRITIDNTTYADYSNVKVYDNTIDANGARIDVGIAQGSHVWFCDPESFVHGASVTGNIFKGSWMGWGGAIDGVHDWVFDDNIFEATFSGPSIEGCGGDIIPAPSDCKKHGVHTTGTNMFQSECMEVPAGESLHGVLISN